MALSLRRGFLKGCFTLTFFLTLPDCWGMVFDAIKQHVFSFREFIGTASLARRLA